MSRFHEGNKIKRITVLHRFSNYKVLIYVLQLDHGIYKAENKSNKCKRNKRATRNKIPYRNGNKIFTEIKYIYIYKYHE